MLTRANLELSPQVIGYFSETRSQDWASVTSLVVSGVLNSSLSGNTVSPGRNLRRLRYREAAPQNLQVKSQTQCRSTSS